jgi:hypothetical protein
MTWGRQYMALAETRRVEQTRTGEKTKRTKIDIQT